MCHGNRIVYSFILITGSSSTRELKQGQVTTADCFSTWGETTSEGLAI